MDEVLSTTMTIKAPAETIFGILADPAAHTAIDGTGWVCEPLDADTLTAADQVFRMAMFREEAGGDYVMANKVTAFDPPRVISWEPGIVVDGGERRYGRWVWRYDLTPVTESETEVRLTYDWSAVSQATRDRMPFQFPPFPPEYLEQSLRHLAELA